MTLPLALPSELTIYTVGELHPQWRAWLETVDAIEFCEVDAQAVTEVDAAGVQLLLSLSAALARQQRQLRLRAPSDALRTACSALGLETWLDEEVTA